MRPSSRDLAAVAVLIGVLVATLVAVLVYLVALVWHTVPTGAIVTVTLVALALSVLAWALVCDDRSPR